MAAIFWMSANDTPTLRKHWSEAGADGFFPKDIELADLDGLILAALEKYQH